MWCRVSCLFVCIFICGLFSKAVTTSWYIYVVEWMVSISWSLEIKVPSGHLLGGVCTRMSRPWWYIGVVEVKASLILHVNTDLRWVVNMATRSLYPLGGTPVPYEKRAGWDPEPGWTFRRSEKFLASTGIRILDRPGPSGSHNSWYPRWDSNRSLPKHI